MKKLLIATLVLIAAYLVGAAVLAVASGQSEGKIISEQKQLLTDGDMEASDTSAWTAVSGATLSKQAGAAVEGSRVLRVAYNGVVNPVAQQAPLTVGKTYRITGWARSDGTAGLAVSTNSYDWIWFPGTTSTDWQRIDATWTAGYTNVRLLALLGGAGYAEFDDIFVTEYFGKTTVADKQILADGDMEAAGIEDWTINIGSASKISGAVNDGKNVMRISYDTAVVARTMSVPDPFTIGKTYRITGWARGDGTAVPRIGRISTAWWTGTASTEWQRFDFIYVATQERFEVQRSAVANGTADFDDIVVTEYIGKIKDTNKQLLTDGDMEAPPTLVANGLADNDMENAGTTDWAVVSGATLSKETGSPHGGSQVLRVVEDTGYGSARPAVSPVTLGTTYIVRGYARSDGTRYPIISQDLIADTWGGTTATDWQYFSVLFTSLNGLIYFGINSTGAPGGYVEFDDVVVQEVTDTGVSDWTAGNDAVLYKDPGGAQEGDYVLRVSYGGTNHPNARQSIMTVGNRYRITGWARGDGGSSYPQILNSSTGEWTGTVSTDWQRVDTIFTAKDTYIRLKTSAFTKGASDWDDILVTAL